MPFSGTSALPRHDPHNPICLCGFIFFPLLSNHAEGVTAPFPSWETWCSGRQDDLFKVTQMGRARADSDPVLCLVPSRSAVPAPILWGQQRVAFFGPDVQHPERPRVNGWPWAWPRRSAFAIGAHENPMRRLGAPFSSWGNWGSGKRGDSHRSHMDRAQHLSHQGKTFHPDHIEGNWFGKSVFGLEYLVYSSNSAVWFGCNAWCIGPVSTWNTRSRTHRWAPTWHQTGSAGRDLWVIQGLLLRSSTCFSVGTCKPVLDYDYGQSRIGVGLEAWGASVPHADCDPAIRAQSRCLSLEFGCWGTHPAEPWARQQTTLPDCLCPVLQTLGSLFPWLWAQSRGLC